MSALLALVLLLAPAPGAQQTPPAQDAADTAEERATKRLLALDPAELPRAEPGRWSGWTPDAPPPETILEPLRRAAALYGRAELVGTLEHLHAVLRSEPDYPPAVYQAGVCYFRLRRYGDAAVLFERYLDAVPERVGDTRALAHCYYTLGRHTKAREHYARVLAARAEQGLPEEPEAVFGYALSQMRLGEDERALELLRRVRELDATHDESALWIAQILYDRGDVEEALEASDVALSLAPHAPRVWFVRARALFELGRDAEAQAAQERFELLDRIDREVRSLSAILALDPRQPRIHQRVVELHAAAGNLEGLREALGRWMAVEPRSIAVRIHALEVLAHAGDLPGAEVAAEELERLARQVDDLEAWRKLATWFARTRQRVKQIEAEDRVRMLTREPR